MPRRGENPYRQPVPSQPTMDHQSVLLREVRQYVPEESRRIVDATLGPGGHARALLTKAPHAVVLGIDRDESSLQVAQRNLAPFTERVNIVLANFRDIDWAAQQVDWEWADVILFDLGLSSAQLSDPERGLSFQQEGPLDMRLDPTEPATAATIVNTWNERALTHLLRELGEEPFASRIAQQILRQRLDHPIRTTTDLVRIIEKAIPARARFARKTHVATNTFRALRMAVNEELESLRAALPKASKLLRPGGILLVISFHSLEDRIVKQTLRDDPTLTVVTKKPITPTEEEFETNPRSRSAKLRIATKQPNT